MMPESYRQFVQSIETLTFFIVVFELLLLVLGSVIFRALLRINLTIKPKLMAFITQLKQAKVVTKEMNQQLHTNQTLLATELLSLGKTLPKPLRWLSKWFGFFLA